MGPFCRAPTLLACAGRGSITCCGIVRTRLARQYLRGCEADCRPRRTDGGEAGRTSQPTIHRESGSLFVDGHPGAGKAAGSAEVVWRPA